MKKYNLTVIMSNAWKLYRKYSISFSEALHRAWAKQEAGITEQTETWHRWKELGYEVIHGSKSLFGAELIYGAKGDGATYKARFFGKSQVQAVA